MQVLFSRIGSILDHLSDISMHLRFAVGPMYYLGSAEIEEQQPTSELFSAGAQVDGALRNLVEAVLSHLLVSQVTLFT